MTVELTPVITAIASGILYSLYWYLNKVVDPTDVTKVRDIDPYPLVATGIIGAAIGVASVFYGTELTQVSVGIQMASYVAITAAVEKGLKTIWRVISTKYKFGGT